MRLYTNNQGSWVGTQADAKREFGKDWSEVGVPTSKDELLEILNFNAVGGEKVEPIVADTPRTAPRAHGQSCSGNREVREAAALNRYDVRDVVLNCPKEYLGGALSAITTRIYDMEDELNA
jgi:hypothetical protein